MNLPNKLTIVRVCLIPFFVAALLFDHGNNYTMRIVANVLFIIASLTDLFDGKIARNTTWSQTSASSWIPLRISSWCVPPLSA